MGLLWSQQEKLAAAVTALQDWEAKAQSVGVHVSQINLDLLPDAEGGPVSRVIFEWDTEAGEYSMRTTGPEGS